MPERRLISRHNNPPPKGQTPMLLYNKMIIAILTTGCSCTFFAADAEHAYAVTAAHCVKDETSTAKIGDKPVGIRWIHIDREKDIAIGKAFAHAVGPVETHLAQAKRGPATIIGYPAMQAQIRTADIPGREATIDGSPKTLLNLQPPIVGGTSGGAVVQDGNLVGVVTHSTPAGGACTTSQDIYTATHKAGIDLNPSTINTRESILMALAAFATHWWQARQRATAKATAPSTTL